MTFPSGFTVEGTVRALGDSARFNPTSVFVALHPEQHDNQLGGGPTDPAGAFTLFDVPPGRYRVWVHLMPEDGYVKSVKYEDRELSDNWIEIGQDGAAGKLEVLMAFDGGEVSGTVEDGNGAPLPGASAHLLTDPPLLVSPYPSRRVVGICGGVFAAGCPVGATLGTTRRRCPQGYGVRQRS